MGEYKSADGVSMPRLNRPGLPGLMETMNAALRVVPAPGCVSTVYSTVQVYIGTDLSGAYSFSNHRNFGSLQVISRRASHKYFRWFRSPAY